LVALLSAPSAAEEYSPGTASVSPASAREALVAARGARATQGEKSGGALAAHSRKSIGSIPRWFSVRVSHPYGDETGMRWGIVPIPNPRLPPQL
jgi:hypothetical protein